MNKLSMAAVAAVLLATPVVSAYAYPDAEIQATLDWQAVVDQANANRLGTAQIRSQGDVAAVKANQASDAVQAPTATLQAQQPAATPSHYTSVQSIRDDN